MAWNINLPASSTKIRLSPAIFQANWQAIEEGSVPYDNLLMEIQAGNPPTSVGFGNVFSKANGSGFAELFFKDDTSNTTRITNGGGVGYWTQPLYGADLRLQTGSTQIVNNQDSLVCAWGTVTGGASSFNQEYNMSSVVRNSTGSYTFTLGFTASSAFNYAVQVTPRKIGSSRLFGAFVSDQTTTTFKVYVFALSPPFNLTSWDYADADLSVTVYGAFT